MADRLRFPRASRLRAEHGAVRTAVVIGAAVVAAAVVAVYALGLVSLHRHVGYFAPAFADDDRAIFVFERRTHGFAWGFGWESFTPPAHAYVLSDEVRLLRVALDGGGVETLEHWPRTPVVARMLSQYRGRLFSHLRAGVRVRADGAVEYGCELALPRVPTSEVHPLHGMWSADSALRRRGEWGAAAGGVVPTSEPAILGERELFEIRGAEAFPAAIAVLDHGSREVRIAIAAPGYAALYPAGPSLDALMQVSRKADHDRVQAMTQVLREREAAHRAQGASEAAATLQAYRDLADLGWLPRPPRWIARRLGAAEAAAHAAAPRFDIDEMEFKVGLMSDLAQAIAQPGAQIDKDGSRYITHRDYPNAARINDALAAGATKFVIGYRGGIYLVTLLPRVEATKK